MAVYVDELVKWPHARGRFKAGSCHLMADDIVDLHAFAAKIGCHRSWYQPHPRHPHYDLVRSFRDKALAAGAVFVPALEQARRRLAKQRSVDGNSDSDQDG